MPNGISWLETEADQTRRKMPVLDCKGLIQPWHSLAKDVINPLVLGVAELSLDVLLKEIVLFNHGLFH